jgi:amidase
MREDLADLDATAQAALVRRGAVTPRELVDAAIARIEALNPQLNAVIHPLFERARRLAASPDLPAGPFRGVPFLVKDLLCYEAGEPLHMGARPLRDAGFVAPGDTYLVQKFRAAGFVILGRTNTPELGTLPTTESDAHGPARNPWNPGRSTGGSSGGSAAAVAARMVAAAHGNDGGGSIRIPASACGLVGLKPSRGRTSFGPDLGDTMGGMVAEGVVTRSVRDTAAILDAIAGYMPGDPYTAPPPARPYREEVGAPPGALRVGVLDRAPCEAFPLHPEAVAAAREAARLLASLGHAVDASHPAALDETEAGQHFSVMYATSLCRMVDLLGMLLGRPIGPEDVDPLNWALAELGRACSASQYLATLDFLHGYTRRMASWWVGGFDLLLTPTLPEPPPPLGTFAPARENPVAAGMRASQFAAFTSPFNLTGQPAVSLPLHWTADGLPVGVQLVAAYGREDLLVRVASQLEAARPWAVQRPAISA